MIQKHLFLTAKLSILKDIFWPMKTQFKSVERSTFRLFPITKK